MVYGISSVIYDSGFSVPEKGSFSEGEGKVVTKCVFWVPRNTSPHRRNDCVTHGGNGGGGRRSGVGQGGGCNWVIVPEMIFVKLVLYTLITCIPRLFIYFLQMYTLYDLSISTKNLL